MDSMEFLFDICDDCDIGSIDDTIYYDNDMILVQNEVIRCSNNADNDLVVNDVFFDHNNVFSNGSIFDSPCDHFDDQKENNITDADEWEYCSESDQNEKFFDDLLAEECAQLLAKEPMFGCVCCSSCKTNAAKGIAKVNEVIKCFRQQIAEMRQSFKKQLCDIKGDLFSSLLDCSRVILDLQMKLYQKNHDAENLLDLTHHMAIRNDSLAQQLCDMTLSFENVCKENIKLREKLGVKLKVVIDSDECKRAIEERKILRRKSRSASESSVYTNTSQTDSNVKLENDLNTAKVLICLADEINGLDEKLNKSMSTIHNLVQTSKCAQNASSSDSLPQNSNRSETEEINSTNLSNREGIRRRIISPSRYRFDDNYIGRNEERDHLKNLNNCNYVNNNKTLNGHTHQSSHSSNYPSLNTYSKLEANHVPLNSLKSHLFSNGYVDSIDKLPSIYNELCMKTLSDLTDEVNKIFAKDNTSNNNSSINMQALQCNSYQSDLYSNASNDSPNNSLNSSSPPPQANGLKLTLKIPKDFNQHTVAENKRFCKHCKTSFPNMTCKQYKDHVYVNCSARNFNKRRVECEKCLRGFLGISGLQSHQRSHKNCQKNGIRSKKNRNINTTRILDGLSAS